MSDNRPPVYNGRYELQSQVARGGTAQVYLARDIILGRAVALKVLFPELSTDSAFVERFRREAQAAASLSHPNIVPVYDWGESDDTYFIVMEYVDGEPLSSIIHSQAPINPGSAAQVAADIAKALTYAHRHGVVHRDVKPGNVLITADGQVKVTDFGIARATGSLDDQVTQTGLVMGTATYFSPEQAQGLDVDGRSDIYSLGVVLYEMLVGRPPFIGDTPVAIAYQHVQETAPRPRSLNPDIPVALEAIVLQAIAKLPAERYQSADELRADLERFLRNQTVLATPPSEFSTGPLTEAITRSAPPTTQAAEAVDSGAGAGPVEAEAPREPTTTPYWVAAAVILLIATVLVGIAGARSLGYFGGTRYVEIPIVKGSTAAAAERKLTTAKLKYHVNAVKNTNLADVNVVERNSPEFPSTLKQGSYVTLYVGGSVTQKPVPSVIGQTKAAARAALKAAGFESSVQTNPFTVNAKPGSVSAQSIPAGTKEVVGTTVTITVIGAPVKVPVPTWTANETAAEAGAALGQKFLEVSSTPILKFSNTVPQGDVMRSEPPAGTLELEGTSVTLVISQGPGIVLPNLVGESVSAATAQLQAMNLVLQVNPTQIAESDPSLSGVILYQTPLQNTKLTTGSIVTVTIGEYSPGASTTTTTTTTVPLTTVPDTTPISPTP
jgi:eukaryotic-like serine/threonine-protein kinase